MLALDSNTEWYTLAIKIYFQTRNFLAINEEETWTEMTATKSDRAKPFAKSIPSNEKTFHQKIKSLWWKMSLLDNPDIKLFHNEK